jgi:multimeric flavodoxin WrbA
MNVLLINGSPNKKGCTYTALCEVATQLENQGIETNIFHIGNKPIRGCSSLPGKGKAN